MKVEDFNVNLMTTKTVFQESLIKEGQTIKIYKVDAMTPKGSEARFFTKGIVTKVDNLMIKYSYFSVSKGDMNNAYLYASDVLSGEPTDSQWEGKESLYIFTLED